ncbi:MAG: universal stress protein [Gammaproteobacteria bacterium]|nr:universal stress protein [Gammaproteobacteria bacterium]
MYSNILCAIDGSASSAQALELAADLSRTHGAHLKLVHVVEPNMASAELARYARIEGLAGARAGAARMDPNPGLFVPGTARGIPVVSIAPPSESGSTQGLIELGERFVQSAKLSIGDGESVEGVCVVGDPAEQIVGLAKDADCDLVVLGSRGLGSVEGLFKGSVSNKVSDEVDCTCIVVQCPAAA